MLDLDALAAAVDFDPWANEILDDAGLNDDDGFDDFPSGDDHDPD